MALESWSALDNWGAHGIEYGAIVKIGVAPAEHQVALVGRSAEEILATTAQLGNLSVLDAVPPSLKDRIEAQQS